VLPGASAYSILNDQRNTLGGWNHIEASNQATDYAGTRLAAEDYRIDASKFLPDATCDAVAVQNAVLVVKLSDWTQQHVNGIEANFDSDDINLNEISHVLLDLRLNRQYTSIADNKVLLQRYGDHLTVDQLAQLDNGKANFSITLFAEKVSGNSSTTVNAEFFFEIAQENYFDQWLRVMVPINELDVYFEQEYERTEAALTDFSEPIKGFRLNPETSKGKQLRNLLGDTWEQSIPETFKEMSISIRRIELLANNREKASN